MYIYIILLSAAEKTLRFYIRQGSITDYHDHWVAWVFDWIARPHYQLCYFTTVRDRSLHGTDHGESKELPPLPQC